MQFFVNKHRFITFACTSILLFAIFAGYRGHFLVSDCNNSQDTLFTFNLNSLSFLGIDSLDQQNQSNKKKEVPVYNNSTDTLLPTDHLRIKLEDPDYDVRYEKGSIKPWHEIRSIYLRRQISPTNFAAIHSHSVV